MQHQRPHHTNTGRVLKIDADHCFVSTPLPKIIYRECMASKMRRRMRAVPPARDYSRTYNEEFDGFVLPRFDGQRIRIRDVVVELV